jgi:serine/threonine protein kinase
MNIFDISFYSRYMAPEVFRGEKYTIKSDIYSFGLVVYYMMKGLY